jgi:hypothetical protein
VRADAVTQQILSSPDIGRIVVGKGSQCAANELVGGFGKMTRQCGFVGGIGISVFTSICIIMQVIRTDLDWLRAPLSFYLIGPYSPWVRGAYFSLSVAIIALGLGYYRALSTKARSAAPLTLFIGGGIALSITALAETSTYQSPPTLAGFVHGVAAQATFLCTTTAMLMQSWRLRHDRLWRARFAVAFGLAVFCFVALWLQVLWRDVPRGLTQKLLVLAILSWLSLAAYWLGSRLPSHREAVGVDRVS